MLSVPRSRGLRALCFVLIGGLVGTGPAVIAQETRLAGKVEFNWVADQFADLRVLRYQVPGWDNLSTDSKILAYYLVQAGLAGRDIMWDQNYRYNLQIRDVLETIYRGYEGDRSSGNWQAFETYLKRVWFSNGIHHHYANDKFVPGFSRGYFIGLAAAVGIEPGVGIIKAIFDPSTDAKKVQLDASVGLVEGSAVNFYDPRLTTEEVLAYYEGIIDKEEPRPISYGLNSRLARTADGSVTEQVWRLDGLYGSAIEQVVDWLGKAAGAAETDAQREALEKLIEYYRTGDLALWDEYNILWVADTASDIDYINGFVEVYNDPLGYRGSFESIVQVKDFEASARTAVLMDNAQWFEDRMPFMDEHKRSKVVGITYNVVNVVGESGDASPVSPRGVNLPNANWIRAEHGSKSISLGNIEQAYEESDGDTYLLEFANDEQEVAWGRDYSAEAIRLEVTLHEVIGHASGMLEPGVATPKETLQSYSSTIEEGRADLVALYFLYDPEMVELGLLPNLDAARSAYDAYIRDGLLKQLRRIEPGREIEEAHMRNRAWISRWVMEKGAEEGVIVSVTRDDKTYYDIRDYDRLHGLFGELLHEVQRIKSQGDFDAARELVENYGVKIDPDLHAEVRQRAASLGIAPYSGFMNPLLTPILNAEGDMVDIGLTYVESFPEQMLYYSEHYGFLGDQYTQ
jgi:dipeptidyl-peptidase-3